MNSIFKRSNVYDMLCLESEEAIVLHKLACSSSTIYSAEKICRMISITDVEETFRSLYESILAEHYWNEVEARYLS